MPNPYFKEIQDEAKSKYINEKQRYKLLKENGLEEYFTKVISFDDQNYSIVM